jgi:predicted MFS family arabinose efflux permease
MARQILWALVVLGIAFFLLVFVRSWNERFLLLWLILLYLVGRRGA